MAVRGWAGKFTFVLAVATALALESQLTWAQQAAAPAGGASNARHGIGLGFGRVQLAGDMATTYDSAVGYHLIYTFESGPTYGLLVFLGMSSHGSSQVGALDSDNLSIKGLNPNLRVNILSTDRMIFSAFGGLGLYKISQNYRGYQAGVTTLGIDGGAQVMVDVDPHFRFGPVLSYTRYFGATDTSATGGPPTPSGSVTGPGVGISGQSYNLFFDLVYFL